MDVQESPVHDHTGLHSAVRGEAVQPGPGLAVEHEDVVLAGRHRERYPATHLVDNRRAADDLAYDRTGPRPALCPGIRVQGVELAVQGADVQDALIDDRCGPEPAVRVKRPLAGAQQFRSAAATLAGRYVQRVKGVTEVTEVDLAVRDQRLCDDRAPGLEAPELATGVVRSPVFAAQGNGVEYAVKIAKIDDAIGNDRRAPYGARGREAPEDAPRGIRNGVERIQIASCVGRIQLVVDLRRSEQHDVPRDGYGANYRGPQLEGHLGPEWAPVPGGYCEHLRFTVKAVAVIRGAEYAVPVYPRRAVDRPERIEPGGGEAPCAIEAPALFQ